MKATVESTDQVVTISDPQGKTAHARVWEGLTEGGQRFVAYITCVQVHKDEDPALFQRDLQEHKRPEPATERAIDLRFVI